MPSMRKIFFEDLGTKALALILALAIWVHVFSGQERQGTFRVPLVIAPLPTGLAIAGEVPREVNLRVRATGADLFKLSTRSFYARVELEEPHEGALQRPVLGSDVQFPHGVRPVLVEVLEPRVLDLEIEPTVSAPVPVAIAFRQPTPADRAFLRPPEASPSSVQITGPRSRLDALDSVRTEPVAVPAGAGSHMLQAALQIPPGMSAEAGSVEVRVETEARRIRRFGPLPVELLPPQGDDLIWVHPDSGRVSVEGAESIVDRVNAKRIRLLADLRGRRGGSRRIVLRAIVPGLPASAPVAIRCFPESVSVRLQ